jgi:hypothetical protein
MKRANIERVSCPIEISLFYSKPDKTSLTSQNETMAIFICEPNGIVREKNKLTYDKELSNSKNNFCIKNQDYLCNASIYSNDGVVLDAATKIIKTRIGAELECLRIARRLASPFCKDAKTDLTAGISLGVSDRLDPAAILLSENFKNFCKTQTLKKIFN